jgi:hypothetical protein
MQAAFESQAIPHPPQWLSSNGAYSAGALA